MTTSIPSKEFDAIITELRRQPIGENKYRDVAGVGRSQCFGIVNKRSAPDDYSRQNWLRPYLYKLLLDFGAKWVDISFNSVTVNQNYKASPHKDKTNCGDSFLVACGSYTGGELEILEGDLKGCYDINCKPIKTDFSKVLHQVKPFEGDRYSFVFYTHHTTKKYKNPPPPLPPFSLREEEGKWYFYRGEEKITRKNGLPHPLRDRKKKKQSEYSFSKETGNFLVEFK